MGESGYGDSMAAMAGVDMRCSARRERVYGGHATPAGSERDRGRASRMRGDMATGEATCMSIANPSRPWPSGDVDEPTLPSPDSRLPHIPMPAPTRLLVVRGIDAHRPRRLWGDVQVQVLVQSNGQKENGQRVSADGETLMS